MCSPHKDVSLKTCRDETSMIFKWRVTKLVSQYKGQAKKKTLACKTCSVHNKLANQVFQVVIVCDPN